MLRTLPGYVFVYKAWYKDPISQQPIYRARRGEKVVPAIHAKYAFW